MEALNRLILWHGTSREALCDIALFFGAELAGISPAAKAVIRHRVFGNRRPVNGYDQHKRAWDAITAHENDTRLPEPVEDGTGA